MGFSFKNKVKLGLVWYMWLEIFYFEGVRFDRVHNESAPENMKPLENLYCSEIEYGDRGAWSSTVSYALNYTLQIQIIS